MAEQLPTREEFETRLTSRESLLETLRGLQEDIEAVVAEAGEERAVRPGSFEDLSLKDVIAHLNGWRELTAARLEAGLTGSEPADPWPAHLDEDEDLNAVNRWFYERDRDKSLATIMAESAETFDRCQRAIVDAPEDALFTSGRYPWVGDYILGPAVVSGTWFHFHEDHEPEIREWLARG